MGSGCRRKSGDSLFHPKVRWGEDSIFNAPAGVGGEPRLAGGVEGVHRPHQADGDQILLVAGLGVVFFRHKRDFGRFVQVGIQQNDLQAGK